MGYLGVPIKPSTILVFSIALESQWMIPFTFGKISAELAHKWHIKRSVYAALREQG